MKFNEWALLFTEYIYWNCDGLSHFWVWDYPPPKRIIHPTLKILLILFKSKILPKSNYEKGGGISITSWDEAPRG